jgi:hypothetical protein
LAIKKDLMSIDSLIGEEIYIEYSSGESVGSGKFSVQGNKVLINSEDQPKSLDPRPKTS